MKNSFLKVSVLLFLLVSPIFALYGVLSGERTDGLNKTCFYNTPEGKRSITIGASEICPVEYDF